MDGLGPKLWTIWTRLKNPHVHPDRVVAAGLGLGAGMGFGAGVGLLNSFYRKFIYVFLINKFFLITILSRTVVSV